MAIIDRAEFPVHRKRTLLTMRAPIAANSKTKAVGILNCSREVQRIPAGTRISQRRQPSCLRGPLAAISRASYSAQPPVRFRVAHGSASIFSSLSFFFALVAHHARQDGPTTTPRPTGFTARTNALINFPSICGPTFSGSRPAAIRNSAASSTL